MLDNYKTQPRYWILLFILNCSDIPFINLRI